MTISTSHKCRTSERWILLEQPFFLLEILQEWFWLIHATTSIRARSLITIKEFVPLIISSMNRRETWKDWRAPFINQLIRSHRSCPLIKKTGPGYVVEVSSVPNVVRMYWP
uniref:Uncharacterized protein n=1 Tax=Populus davidiana TaxID=266767 RepID=A0A6M2EZ74_9ROSI